MSKTVAKSIRNREFQEKKNGDLAVLFFKEACPYCRDFKPTWNRVAKGLKKRWHQDSMVYDEDEKTVAKFPLVRKIDVAKFPNVQKMIGFPTVPTVALYKKGHLPVFLITKDRSLPNVLKQVENYYKRHEFPPKGEYLIGNEYGEFPRLPEKPIQTMSPIQKTRPIQRTSPIQKASPDIYRQTTPKVSEFSEKPRPVVKKKATQSQLPSLKAPTLPEDEIFARLLAKLVKHKNKF